MLCGCAFINKLSIRVYIVQDSVQPFVGPAVQYKINECLMSVIHFSLHMVMFARLKLLSVVRDKITNRNVNQCHTCVTFLLTHSLSFISQFAMHTVYHCSITSQYWKWMCTQYFIRLIIINNFILNDLLSPIK